MEQGYAKRRTVGRWGWGIRVKKRSGERNNGLCGKRGRIGNCHKRNLCSEQLIGARCILANVSSNGETILKISKCSKFLHDLTRHLRTSEMSQRKFGIATILPVTDSFVSVAFVRCLVVLRIDSVASKESNTCLVGGLSQFANFRGTCFRFLICKSPNLRSWPATYFSRWFLLPQRRIKA